MFELFYDTEYEGYSKNTFETKEEAVKYITKNLTVKQLKGCSIYEVGDSVDLGKFMGLNPNEKD